MNRTMRSQLVEPTEPRKVWCPVCGKPAEVSVQRYPAGEFYIATCWHRGCKMYAVTLSAGKPDDDTSGQCAIGDASVMKLWEVRPKYYWNTGHEII